MQILRGLVCRSMIQTGQCGEGLTDVKGEGTDIERVSVQEHDTHTTIRIIAVLWNHTFTKCILLYLYTI